MTNKYENVYLKDSALVVGKYEGEGPMAKYFDKKYDEFYMDEKTFEQAEIHLMRESIDFLLYKTKIAKENINLFLAGDLSNQVSISSFVASELRIPFLGLYNACATIGEAMIIAANMIDSKHVKKAICAVSSHNLTSEKQFRNPVEYGTPKPQIATFTTTGGASILLTGDKTNIKIESGTIGKVIDMGITDPFYMGAVMAPAAADTLNQHLQDLNREVSYYDLIVTGDLGFYGRKIMIDYMKKEYKIELKNYNDCGVMLYDLKKQPVFSGGSGPACLPLVAFGHILNQMKIGKLKKVLLIPTGALFSPTTIFQKKSIPAIAHAVSLEVLK